MKVRSGTLFTGVLVAGLVAGPLFLITTVASALYLQLPRPIIIEPGPFAGFMFAMLPTTVVGALIGWPVNAIGGNLMALLGQIIPSARTKLSWAVVGGTAGLVFAVAVDAPLEASTGLVVTSTACAWLCSRWVEWSEE